MEYKSVVLIVDDEAAFREILKEVLAEEGYQLAFAASGTEALALTRKLIPDLILLDVLMPDMSGLEVCARLRADPYLAQIPIVMVTGLHDAGSRIKALEAGADDFITKPFEPAELVTRVRTVTRLNQYRRLLEEREQREKAERTLRETHELLAAVFSSLDQAVFVLDPEMRTIVTCNSAVEHVFGYKMEEVVGFNIEFLHVTGEMHQEFRQKLLAALDSEGIFVGENPMRRKDGSAFASEYTVTQIVDESGRRRGVVSVVRDVTERKRIEQELRESEERYRDFVEGTDNLVTQVDRAGRFTFVNHAAQEILGLPPEECVGLSALDFIHPEDRERTRMEVRRWAQEKARTRTFENRQVSRDGQVRHILWSFSLHYDDDGHSIYNNAIGRDISEHKRAAQSLERYARRLRLLHETDQAILVARSPEAIAQAALAHIRELVPCAGASVVTFDREAGEATVLVGSTGGPTGPKAGERVPAVLFGDEKDLRQGKAHIVEDIRACDLEQPVLQALFAAGVRSFVSLPLVSHEELIGALNLASHRPGAFEAEHVDIAREVADSLAVAVQNALLLGQLHAGHERLRTLSARLVDAQETERRRIARELHDEVGQILAGLKLILEMSARLPAESIRESLTQLRDLVDDLITRVRDLSLDLRPPMLDDLGPLPTLMWHFDRFATLTHVDVTFKHAGIEDRRFAPEVETAAYRVVQEALTNVARHAGVRTAEVRVWADYDALHVQVQDRGSGFDVEAALAAGTTSGLNGMFERVRLLGGQITIESTPESGTCLAAELPVGDPSNLHDGRGERDDYRSS